MLDIKLIKNIITRDKGIFLAIVAVGLLIILTPGLYMQTKPSPARPSSANKKNQKDLFQAEINRFAAVEQAAKNKEKIRFMGFVVLVLGYPAYLLFLGAIKKRNPFFVEEKVTAVEDNTASADFKKRQLEIAQAQKKLKIFADRLNEIGKHLGSQQSAQDFQKWFYDLLDFLEIPNRRPYVQGGRLINGSLTVSGSTYLVEVKLSISQVDQTTVEDFFKKVTYNNMQGLFLSISGFTEKARKSVSQIKPPLLLLEAQHLHLVLSGTLSMSEVIDKMRRQEGLPQI